MVLIISVQNKNFTGNRKELAKVRGADGNQKSFILTMAWNLAKLAKTYPEIIVRRHLTFQRQRGLLSERDAELTKDLLQYSCNQAWAKNGWQIPWSASTICETFKTSYRTGKHVTNRDLANHNSLWLVSWISQIFCKSPVQTPPVREESRTRNIPRICLARGTNLERRHFGRRHRGSGKLGRVRNPCSKTQRKRGDNA